MSKTSSTINKPEELSHDEWVIIREHAAAEVAKRRAAARAETDRLAGIEQDRLARIQAAERFAAVNKPARAIADLRAVLDRLESLFGNMTHAQASEFSAYGVGELIRFRRAFPEALRAHFPLEFPAGMLELN